METEYVTISDRKVTLEEAQKFVGGWVERVKIGKDFYLVDEEGLLKSLPKNEQAFKESGHPFVGNVMRLTGAAKRGWG